MSLSDSELDKLPPILRAWLTQLLSVDVINLAARTKGQIELRLYANDSRVRRNPMIVLNGGPQPNDAI